MSSRLVAAALAGVLLAMPALAQSPADTLKKVAETKTLLLGYLAESVPFSFADNNGNPAGYSVDLRGVSSRVSCPWPV